MIVPPIAAFAKIVQKTPILEHFSLAFDRGYTNPSLRIAYYVPGHRSGWNKGSEHYCSVRPLYYEIDHDWKLDVEIVEGLRCACMEKYCG
jgi:hypothetical protein